MIFGLRGILIAFCVVYSLNSFADCYGSYYEPKITPYVKPTIEPTIVPTIEPTIKPIIKPTIKPKPDASVFNRFAFSISRKLLSEIKDENVFISPFSITTGLLMTYFGAHGSTSKEIKNVLRLSKLSDKKKLSIYKNHVKDLLKNNKGAKDFKLNTANRIFISNRVSINPTFQNLLKDNFKADIQTLNFDEKTNSANEINKWVKKETNDKIQNLIKSKDLTSDTRLVLVNAIYYKATWKAKFDPKLTKKIDFHLSDGTSKKVDMMNSRFRLKCKFNSKRIGADVCELPYLGEKFSMLLILPKKGSDVRKVEKKLSAKSFEYVLKNLKQTLVKLQLPKFKIQFRKELKEDLKKMGMVTPFSLKANFKKMINEKMGLFVSNVIHEAVISVDENGTEASAATLVQINEKTGGSDFICNRPFIYVIYHKSSKNVLFIGKLVKP